MRVGAGVGGDTLMQKDAGGGVLTKAGVGPTRPSDTVGGGPMQAGMGMCYVRGKTQWPS